MCKIKLHSLIYFGVVTIQLMPSLLAQEIKTYNGSYENGTANYQYFENDNYERVFHGAFSYKEDQQKTIKGRYTENQKTGQWIYINGNRYTKEKIIGNYKNNLRDGQWNYSCTNSITNKLEQSIRLNYKNGLLINELVISYYGNEIKGEFNKDGDFEGNWIRKTKNGASVFNNTESIFKFKKGVCYFYLCKDISTGKVHGQFDKTSQVMQFFDSLNVEGLSSFNGNTFALTNKSNTEFYPGDDFKLTYHDVGKDPLGMEKLIIEFDQSVNLLVNYTNQTPEEYGWTLPSIWYIVDWTETPIYDDYLRVRAQKDSITNSYKNNSAIAERLCKEKKFKPAIDTLSKLISNPDSSIYQNNLNYFNEVNEKYVLLQDSIQVIAIKDQKTLINESYHHTKNQFTNFCKKEQYINAVNSTRKFIKQPEDVIYTENLNELRLFKNQLSHSVDSALPFAIMEEQNLIQNEFQNKRTLSSKLFNSQKFIQAYQILTDLYDRQDSASFIDNIELIELEKNKTLIFKDSLLTLQKDVENYFNLKNQHVSLHAEITNVYKATFTDENQILKAKKKSLFKAYYKIYQTCSNSMVFTPQLLIEAKNLRKVQIKVIELYPLKTKTLEKELENVTVLQQANDLILKY